MNSNAIATIGNFSVTRVSKSGKETKRNFAGVVSSGNKAERQQALQSLVTHHYSEGQFTMLAENMVRVFGKDFMTAARFCGLNPITGGARDKATKAARAAWEDLIVSIQPEATEKALKGEKALWVEVLQNAQKTYEARKASLQAQADAMGDNNTVETTVTEVQPLQLAAPAADAPAADAPATEVVATEVAEVTV